MDGYVKFDASRCNLGQTFLDMLERDGTTLLDIPGEAHEQMGDVESQGWHFEETFRRVVDQMPPPRLFAMAGMCGCHDRSKKCLDASGWP